MRNPLHFLWLSVVVLGATTTALNAQLIVFGPTEYLSVEDIPEGFGCSCDDEDCNLLLEDFEDGDALNFGFSFVNGDVLGPTFESGIPNLTDSVDGDDGDVDGSGSKGWSYYSPGQWIQVNYPTGTTNAGVVWTDGHIGVTTVFEAYDLDGNLLDMSGPHQLADDSFTGTTAEDRFYGVYNEQGVSRIVIRNIGQMGIELDHVLSADCTIDIPEPATGLLLPFMAALAFGYVRRRT